MGEASESRAYLQQSLQKFQRELHENGCLEVNNLSTPNLRNEIHPIFAKGRWVTGFGQVTHKSYQQMKPALQLASLLLTENPVLPWFQHVTYGHRTEDCSEKPPKVYIAVHKGEHTSRAKEETRRRLEDMSSFLTLMFVPSTEATTANGLSFAYLHDVPWYRQFRSTQLPHFGDEYKAQQYAHHGQPAICMAASFHDYFSHEYKNASLSYHYRMMYFFTMVLVHECAHAYYMYLGRSKYESKFGPKEPLWSQHEKIAELGYSWETVTLGRITYPMYGRANNVVLTSYQEEHLSDQKERDRAIIRIIGGKGSEMLFERVEKIPKRSQQANGWRGTGWFSRGDNKAKKSTVAILHAIPMWWVAHWFREEEWEKKRRTWRESKTYEPPSLGSTLILVCQRNEDGKAMLHRVTNGSAADPYLDKLKVQATKMHLYDD
ncbi:hypothetical protein K504DRAFT_490902 [Pleomassaria siparia CBS 279.74]|uniref:Uncharacterized protein n=1 Tax=Pleomassaria siparia CBS 279.74 TaxID=1314801 RepID=A0A6G1K9A6_9PLEO|nr:hypothetical protein K504DRAFT_490902 [Pleomassaria siparia CBS 279.74]